MSDRAVVDVTGVGVVSPLGCNAHEFWRGLLDQRVGFTRCSREQAEVGTTLVGSAPFEPRREYRRVGRHTRTMNRTSELLLAAVNECTRDARLDVEPVEGDRIAVVVGVGAVESYDDVRLAAQAAPGSLTDRLRSTLDPLRRLRHLPNIGASLVSIEYGAAGPALTLVGDHCSGLAAVLEARALIVSGVVDVAVCGGVDSRLERGLLSQFAATTSLSRRTRRASACLPFHYISTGTIAAEGAAVLVLEEHSSARRRHVPAYATVVGGYAAGGVSRGVIEDVMRRTIALDRQGPIGAVIAHGDGTAALDDVEAAGLRSVFDATASVQALTSIKGCIGHTMTAAGAFNAVTACLAIEHGLVPALPLRVRPRSALPFVTGRPTRLRSPRVLATAMDPRGVMTSTLFTSPAS